MSTPNRSGQEGTLAALLASNPHGGHGHDDLAAQVADHEDRLTALEGGEKEPESG